MPDPAEEEDLVRGASPRRRLPERLVRGWAARPLASPPPAHGPVTLLDLELSQPVPPQLPSAAGAGGVEVLVRLHGEPLGLLHAGSASADDLSARVEAELADRVDEHLRQDGLARDELPLRGGASSTACSRCAPVTDELVSVVVATAGRSHLLPACIDAILRSTHRCLELVVVDNRPADPATRLVVERAAAADERVRYVAEPVPGTSAARNAGIRAARGAVIAFTDDDAQVDPGWLAALVRGFGRSTGVVAVTGLTLAAELATTAQLGFEHYGAWPRSMTPRLFDLDAHRGDTLLYPWTAGAFGASNNLAVRRDVLAARGGFDQRLGPATPTYSGEDVDLLLDLVMAGGVLAYEPAAVVRHLHRAEVGDLCWQVFTYGVGMTTLLVRWLVRDRRLSRDLVRKAPAVLRALLAPAGAAAEASPLGQSLERRLRWIELAGFLYGPIAWLLARRGDPGVMWPARRGRRRAATG